MLVEPATRQSQMALTVAIAHIHALEPGGPRHNPATTEKEANSFENLLLLCPNHHSVADQQHETYTAEQLRRWKHEHEAEALRPIGSLTSDKSRPPPSSRYPTELANEHIQERLNSLRKSRFYVESDTTHHVLLLGERLVVGDLSPATDSVRCRALAWCATVLSDTQHHDTAQRYLDIARLLCTSPETATAKAVLAARTGDTTSALKTLGGIDTPRARSTSFWLLIKHRGASVGIDWLKAAAIRPEGRFMVSGGIRPARGRDPGPRDGSRLPPGSALGCGSRRPSS